ncbi:MAG: hypothetical protein JRJ38_16685 [Deltaproteobacteria bacterium]|nr:hypothetical protein [Deltaproteobacteria bacterium]
MPSLAETPLWYLGVMFLLSIYHAYRGFMLQWIFAHQQNQEAAKNNLREWSKAEIVVVRCVEDALFYFVCSLAGFFALHVAGSLWKLHGQCEAIDTGASVLIVVSFLIGIIGVSGQLPPLIQLGKFPGVR